MHFSKATNENEQRDRCERIRFQWARSEKSAHSNPVWIGAWFDGTDLAEL